jgi:hypothetical protein
MRVIVNTLFCCFLLSGCSSKFKNLPSQSTTETTGTKERQDTVQLLKIEDLENILEQGIKTQKPNDILIVFDFNYTLLHPTEPALRKKNIERHKAIFSALLQSLKKEECDRLLSDTLKTASQEVVSEKTPGIIQKFAKTGVNFVVCTGSLTKTRGGNSADVIIQLLAKCGITLDSSKFPFKHLNFKEFNEYIGGYPAYNNGIITANRSDKGAVLSAFFKRLTKMPKVVIFVDNNSHKVSDVLKIASNFNDTKFIVCEYKEYANLPAPQISEQDFVKFWQSRISDGKRP